MKKNWKFIVSMLVVGFVAYIILNPRSPDKANNNQETIEETSEVHIHAGFQVYENGELADFSGFEYMKLEPCGDHSETDDEAHEQLERAHLHDGDGDVVHVHRDGSTWGDLFANINFEIASPSAVYLNQEIFSEDILNNEIKAYDTVVIFTGENGIIEEPINNSVTKERILEVESKSENCAS